MKSIRLYLLSACMLLVMAMPAMAQSARLDSLQRVQQNIELQSQQLQLQYDSLYRIIAQCKTDDERLVQHAVIEKLDKRNQQLGNKMRKIEQEIQIEKARIEQEQRDANLAKKQAAAQAVSPLPLKGEINGHPWVDLGLPSGTKWATYNVGTTAIHGVGTRIAWGETATKKLFSPDTYTHNEIELPSYAGNAEYDLATLQWGDDWYTPTLQQWEELIEHCQWEYVMINGINGVLFTSHKTYNTIFLPSTGYTDDETYKLKYTTYNLAYWASTG
jgi:TolA-binding protein